MALVVAGARRCVQPLQPVLVGGDGQPSGVVEVERHPAVPHQPEVVAALLPHRGELGQVRSQPGHSLVRRMVQWHLSCDEAHLLGQIVPRGAGVEGELVAGRATQQVVHGLLPEPAQQVVEGEADGADDVEHQAFPAVEQRGPIHLVPDLLDVGDRGTLQETGQVALDDPCAGLAGRCDAEADGAVIGLNLYDQGAQHVQTEGATALGVLRIARNRGGDVVVDPVVALLIVIVGPTAGADSVCADLPNTRHAQPGSCAVVGGPCGNTRILLAVVRPLARSSKLCGAPSQPTRPSISASMPSGTVPTHAAVLSKSSAV